MHHRLSTPADLARLTVGSRDWAITRLTLDSLFREVAGSWPTEATGLAPADLQAVFEDCYGFLAAAGHDLAWTLPLEFAAYLRSDSDLLWRQALLSSGNRWLASVSNGATWLTLRRAGTGQEVFSFERKESLAGANQVFVLDGGAPGLDPPVRSPRPVVWMATGTGPGPDDAEALPWVPCWSTVLHPPGTTSRGRTVPGPDLR